MEYAGAARVPAMKVESNAHPRRWAPEWIAVLTLAVAIVGLGGGMLTSLNAMEVRLRGDMQVIREDMRSMESRLREDMREIRSEVGVLGERVTRLDERVSQLDERVSRLDRRVSHLDERVLRLETRFDEEFPPGSASLRSRALHALPDRVDDRRITSDG